MKKLSKKSLMIIFLVLFVAIAAIISVCLLPLNKGLIKEISVLGTGGYGAVFNAKIDPFNENYYGATCDMGSVYFSFNKGESFFRHDIQGTAYCLEYDVSTNGVVWVGGSGIYKSTDHGKTLNLVFPKKSEITYAGNNYENANYWIYTDGQSDYAPHYQIWSIAINRKSGGKNVFAAQRVPSSGQGTNQSIRIYRTLNGEDFEFFTEVSYEYNFKIDYDESNDCLLVITKDKIVWINSNAEIAWTLQQKVYVQFINGNNICFASYYDKEKDKNTFVFSSPIENNDHIANICYKTNNLRDKNSYIDITAKLANLTTNDFGIDKVESYNQNRPSYEYCEWIGGKTVPQQFKWTISDVYVLNDDVVYLFHRANTNTYDAGGNLYINRRTQIFLKYDEKKSANEQFKWVYGFPLKPYNKYIENTTWQDSDSDYCLGMSGSKFNEDALLYCTNVGIYYTSDGEKVVQLNSIKQGSKELTFTNSTGEEQTKTLSHLTTTGIDVICTHMLVTDPFDSNHLLICCTDIGLTQSYDNGKSWFHALYEWDNGALKDIKYASYTNTCFDVHFDKERQNVVYGLWSHTKTAPYNALQSYLTEPARFGISYDGGLSWEMKNITADGKYLPYRMQVLYKGNEREIYIATDGNGIFVTKDLGESFTSMNEGLDISSVGEMQAIWTNEILICKMGTFVITGGSATDSTSQMLYKWDDTQKKFIKIGLPTSIYNGREYHPAAIRDIIYDEQNDCLYLACTAMVVTNYSKLIKTAGGIWKYKDGEFTQIYDEEISVFALNIDSAGRLYAAELNGKLIRFNQNNTQSEIVLDNMFHRLKSVCFGTNDKIIYVATWGGGTYKIELN